MGTIATGRATRQRSTIVFWALVALVIVVAMGSQLARQAVVPMAPPELSQTTLDTASLDADGRKAAGLELMLAPAEAAMPLIRDDLAAAVGVEGAAAPPAARPAAVDDALIVRTGSLELEVEDVATSLGKARREIAALGGYVAGSDEYD
ncbi:MAG: hypothetical protein ACHQ02_09870, partial [Candidatus Limnocylindrales bacterium]